MANLPNRYSALCWRPVTHAQTWASYSELYRFGRLSQYINMMAETDVLTHSSLGLFIHKGCLTHTLHHSSTSVSLAVMSSKHVATSQPIKELSYAAGRCVRRGSALSSKKSSKVLPKPHGPMGRRWSLFPITLSQTPAYTARPRIRG